MHHNMEREWYLSEGPLCIPPDVCDNKVPSPCSLSCKICVPNPPAFMLLLNIVRSVFGSIYD